MTRDKALKSVRIGAAVLMLPMAVEMIRYGWTSFARIYRFGFGEPERWNTHWRVDPGTVIEFAPRVGYSMIWGGVVCLSLLAYLIGLFLLNRCRRGQIFDERTARAVHVLGAVLAIAMICDMVFAAMDAYLITRFNAAGPEPIRWAYDPSDLKTLTLAMILFLFGWIMRQGVEVARENKGFV